MAIQGECGTAYDSKLLTISVAAYNVENTIEQCLKSCLECERANEIEVIVVDDGSTDGTVDMLDRYANDYPHIVRAVHKENGGYGSTVNTSVAIASGKYYRLLDGDDWVDSDGLDNLLELLGTQDVDLAISPFTKRWDGGSEVIDQSDKNVEGVVDFAGDVVPESLSMHSIVYRTELVRESGLHLPEHRLYTDTLYNTIPLQLVNNSLVSHVPVYQYRVAHAGQSISWESLESHYEDFCSVVKELEALYSGLDDKDSLAAKITSAWLVGDITWLISILVGMPPSDTMWQKIREVYRVAAKDSSIYERCLQRSSLFKGFAKVPRIAYPIVARGYRITQR